MFYLTLGVAPRGEILDSGPPVPSFGGQEPHVAVKQQGGGRQMPAVGPPSPYRQGSFESRRPAMATARRKIPRVVKMMP